MSAYVYYAQGCEVRASCGGESVQVSVEASPEAAAAKVARLAAEYRTFAADLSRSSFKTLRERGLS